MALIVIDRTTDLSVTEAWHRLTRWENHAKYVPFTEITVESDMRQGVGTLFVARTGTARVGFDDPMLVTTWEPPTNTSTGFCHIDKRGSVVTGWAELRVEPTAEGTQVEWREDARVRGGRLTDIPTKLASRILFGRVVSRLLADS